jgi:PAS domain S-box-containing protein
MYTAGGFPGSSISALKGESTGLPKHLLKIRLVLLRNQALSWESWLRVLIVDDHEVVRRGVCSLLATAEGFEVCGEAVDGRDAIEKARELKPDVITMDISMPNLNGLEATQEIHRFLPDVSIVMMSQHDLPEMMKQALNAGAVAYVVKSGVATELLPALEKLRQKEDFPGLVFGSAHANLNLQELLDERTAALNKATRELEMAAAHLELVTSHAAALVTRCSRDLRFLWVSPACAEWLQLPLPNIVGQRIEDVLEPEAFETLRPYFERVLRGEKVAYEREVVYKGVGRKWISAKYTPTFDSTGTPDGWVAVVTDLTERRQMEQARRDSELRLYAEAKALRALHNLSSKLWATTNLEDGLKQMLDGAIQLLAADKGSVQLLDTERGVLAIVAQCGFNRGFLDFFREVAPDNDSACGRALRTRRAVVIPDVEAEASYVPYLEVARSAGYRAVTSVPLLANDGTVLGIFSTHFRFVHAPSDESLCRLQLYARQAADFIVRCNSQSDLEHRVDQRTKELQDANGQLRELSGRLLKAQDEERRRIARELHDGVGQLLAATAMNISKISRERFNLSPAAAQCVKESGAMIQQVTDEIRTMSHLLHPPLLEEVGLESALREYVKGFQQRSNVTITLNVPKKFERLPMDYEVSLFRIAQECLTNVHRHSGSTTALVRLQGTADEVVLEVSDDGAGIKGDLREISGVGVRGMRERMRQLGGSLRIQSAGRGTTVRASLPSPQKNAIAQAL